MANGMVSPLNGITAILPGHRSARALVTEVLYCLGSVGLLPCVKLPERSSSTTSNDWLVGTTDDWQLPLKKRSANVAALPAKATLEEDICMPTAMLQMIMIPMKCMYGKKCLLLLLKSCPMQL